MEKKMRTNKHGEMTKQQSGSNGENGKTHEDDGGVVAEVLKSRANVPEVSVESSSHRSRLHRMHSTPTFNPLE